MKSDRALILTSSQQSLTLIALAVVQSMRVDAVRSGRYVPQVDDHRVSLFGHQQGSQVAQPVGLCHFCPVGGAAVLFVYSLLVDGANALGASLQKDCGFSAEKEIEKHRWNIFYSYNNDVHFPL